MADLRISGASTSPRSESDIRLNYGDPSRIIASSNDINNPTMAMYSSTDGGVTWSQAALPAQGSDNFQADPAVDWTSDGTAWSLALGVDGSMNLRLYAFSSTGGSPPWTLDAIVSGSQTAADREILWVDHSPTSPFKDQVYATWHNNAPVFFARRTTGPGGGWQTPIQLSGAETTATGIGGDVKSNAFGDIFVFWPDPSGSSNHYVVKSTDGGQTFSTPVTIAPILSSSRRLSIPADSNRQARVYISAAAYRTAAKDMVYVVWTDLGNDPSTNTDPNAGCTSTTSNGPGTSTGSACKTRVWFSRSVDGGATWSTPVKLNDQSGKNDQFHSRLTVDESNGNLMVAYQDTVADSGRKKTDVYIQTSTDDGLTWSAATKITSAQSDETGAGADSNQYGDYNGLHGFCGTFFPSWTDSRAGIEEIWTSKVLFGKCIASLEVAVSDNGDFGDVCLGEFVDRGLVINNRGPCPLSIESITSSSIDFVPPSVASYPLIVAAGDSVELPIRFQPHNQGAAAATITITSNDPASPKTIDLTGNTPVPRLVISIANAGNFGEVCIGSFNDEPLTVANSGGCALTVTGITSSSPEFIPPAVDTYPFVVPAGGSVEVQVRFQPTSFGPKAATLTVTSDDPGGPRSLNISGSAPSGTVTVTGSGHFGPVDLGRRAERTISVHNVGNCDLRVLKVAFLPDERKPGCHDRDDCGCGSGCGCDDQHDHGHEHEDERRQHKSDQCCATFKIDSNPFPARLRPGASMPVLLRFIPTCAGPQCCELLIETDDPATPRTIVFVTGSLRRTLRAAVKCWAAEEIQDLLKAGKHW
jgi:hypothetical protein